jgi:AraC-like DNA-binding protein
MTLAQLLLVAALSIGVLIVTLLLSKSPKIEADKYLLAYLGYFLVNQLFYLAETYEYFANSYLPLYTRGFYLICPPLFYLYLYKLTSFGKHLPKYTYAFFLPFIGFTATFIYYYSVGFDTFSLTLQQGLIYQNDQLSIIWAIFSFFLVILDPICLLLFYGIYKRYTYKLKQSTSDIDAVQLKWLQSLFLFWTVSVVLIIPLHVLSINQQLFPSAYIQILYQVSSLTFIFILGWYGLKQKIIYHGIVQNSPQSAMSYARSGLDQQKATHIHQQLLQYLENNKPYLKGDLKAAELAESLNISTSHLSQVLNQKQGQNFFEFINQYRVKAVQEKMKDPAHHHLTILGIAYDAGFNSKTSFNQLFKKFTGETPSSYYKKVK